MKVLDLSSYQKNIDFNKIKEAGVEGVILRCVVKDGSVDKCFNDFYNKAKSLGLHIGAYTYSYDLTIADAMKRAYATQDAMKDKTFDLGFFLDLEYAQQRQCLTKEEIHRIIFTYKSNLQCRVAVYCNLDWYKNVITNTDKNEYWFWIARYPSTQSIKVNQNPDNKWKPNVKNMLGWQYSSKCNVSDMYVDISEWYENITGEHVYDATVSGIQELLNDKYNAGLKVDGKYGKLTNKAIIDNLK